VNSETKCYILANRLKSFNKSSHKGLKYCTTDVNLKANHGTVAQYLQAEIHKNLIQYNVHTIKINYSSSNTLSNKCTLLQYVIYN